MIAESIKLLPLSIKLILSFADPSRNHTGIIYQATNFLYCGMSAGGKVLVTSDGIEKHPRLLGIYRMRHPEYEGLSNQELMDKHKWTYKASSKKHRYIMLRGKKLERKRMKKLLEHQIMSYPKADA